MSFRPVIKAALAGLAIALVAIVAFVLIQATGARRLSAGWQKNLTVDSWQVVDGGGSPVIAGVARGRFVGLYKAASGELLWRYALDLNAAGRAVKAVAISADGRTVAAAGVSGKIKIFDRFANEKSSFAAGESVAALALSGDGRRLARIGEDGRITLSDTAGKSGGRLRVGPRPVGVHLNRRGDKLLMATSKTLEAWSADGRKLWSRAVDAKKLSVAAESGDAAVLTRGGRVRLYSGAGRLLWVYSADNRQPGFASVAVAGPGNYVAAGTAERLYIIDKNGSLINSYRNAADARANIAFAGHDRILISGGNGLFTGHQVGEAIQKTAGFEAAMGWASPTAAFLLLMIGAGLFGLRQQPQPQTLGEVRELPVRDRRKRPRKAA